MQFIANKTYTLRLATDHESIMTFRITRRSQASVWLQRLSSEGKATGEPVRRSVVPHNGNETCFPLARYSMAPILSAEKLA